MFRPTHHTYYKGVDAIINPMNRYNTNVRQMKENSPAWSPEELDIIANGKKAVENDLSRLIPPDIVAKTAHVKVSHNDKTETMCPLHQYTHTCVAMFQHTGKRSGAGASNYGIRNRGAGMYHHSAHDFFMLGQSMSE